MSARRVKLSPEMVAALEEQRAAFVAKFGREPGPNDPVFFDPDKDTPTRMDPSALYARLSEAAERAGIDSERVLEFLRAGL
jgi:integrase